MHSLLFVLAILGQRHAMFGAPPAPAPAPAVEMRAPATDPAQLLKGANQKLLDQQREIGDLQKQVDALKAERDKAQTALIAATARSRIHTDELATARAEIARLKAALAASGNHSIDAPKPAAPEAHKH